MHSKITVRNSFWGKNDEMRQTKLPLLENLHQTNCEDFNWTMRRKFESNGSFLHFFFLLNCIQVYQSMILLKVTVVDYCGLVDFHVEPHG